MAIFSFKHQFRPAFVIWTIVSIVIHNVQTGLTLQTLVLSVYVYIVHRRVYIV